MEPIDPRLKVLQKVNRKLAQAAGTSAGRDDQPGTAAADDQQAARARVLSKIENRMAERHAAESGVAPPREPAEPIEGALEDTSLDQRRRLSQAARQAGQSPEAARETVERIMPTPKAVAFQQQQQAPLSERMEKYYAENNMLERAGQRLTSGYKGAVQASAASTAANNIFVVRAIEAIERGASDRELHDLDPSRYNVTLSLKDMPAVERQAILGEAEQRIGQKVSDVTRLASEIEAIPKHPAAEDLAQAETFADAFRALVRDPVGVINQLGLESLPRSAPSIVLGTAGGLAGGAPGAVGGAFMGASGVEFQASIMEGLTRAGVDVTKPGEVEAAMRDPEVLQAIVERAQVRGLIVGGFDAASFGLGRLTFAPQAAGRLASRAIDVAAGTPIQAAMGAGGEAAAQLVTEGEIEPGEVVAEAVGEAFQAPAEIAGAGLGAYREGRKDARQQLGIKTRSQRRRLRKLLRRMGLDEAAINGRMNELRQQAEDAETAQNASDLIDVAAEDLADATPEEAAATIDNITESAEPDPLPPAAVAEAMALARDGDLDDVDFIIDQIEARGYAVPREILELRQSLEQAAEIAEAAEAGEEITLGPEAEQPTGRRDRADRADEDADELPASAGRPADQPAAAGADVPAASEPTSAEPVRNASAAKESEPAEPGGSAARRGIEEGARDSDAKAEPGAEQLGEAAAGVVEPDIEPAVEGPAAGSRPGVAPTETPDGTENVVPHADVGAAESVAGRASESEVRGEAGQSLSELGKRSETRSEQAIREQLAEAQAELRAAKAQLKAAEREYVSRMPERQAARESTNLFGETPQSKAQAEAQATLGAGFEAQEATRERIEDILQPLRDAVSAAQATVVGLTNEAQEARRINARAEMDIFGGQVDESADGAPGALPADRAATGRSASPTGEGAAAGTEAPGRSAGAGAADETSGRVSGRPAGDTDAEPADATERRGDQDAEPSADAVAGVPEGTDDRAATEPGPAAESEGAPELTVNTEALAEAGLPHPDEIEPNDLKPFGELRRILARGTERNRRAGLKDERAKLQQNLERYAAGMIVPDDYTPADQIVRQVAIIKRKLQIIDEALASDAAEYQGPRHHIDLLAERADTEEVTEGDAQPAEPAQAEPLQPVEEMNKQAMLGELRERGVDVPSRAKVKDVRNALREARHAANGPVTQVLGGRYLVGLDASGNIVVTNLETGKPVEGRRSSNYEPAVVEYILANIQQLNQAARVADEAAAAGQLETIEQFADLVASDGVNIFEILEAWSAAQQLSAERQGLSAQRDVIASYFESEGDGQRILTSSFESFGDPAMLEGAGAAVRLNYLTARGGQSLDVLAELLSSQNGYEVTPDDIIQFMLDYPGGPSAYRAEFTSLADQLANRFREVTGVDLSDEMASAIFEGAYATPSEGQTTEPEQQQQRQQPGEPTAPFRRHHQPTAPDAGQDAAAGRRQPGELGADRGQAAQASPIDVVKQHLEDMAQRQGLPKVNVLTSALDLPREAARVYWHYMKLHAGRWAQPAMYFDGEVYILAGDILRLALADGVDPLALARATYLHEVVAHDGLRGLLGDQHADVMTTLYELIGLHRLSDAGGYNLLDAYADQLEGDSPASYTDADKALLADEYLARLAEGLLDANPGLIRRILDALRTWWDSLGIDEAPISDADLQLLLLAAADHLRAGQSGSDVVATRFMFAGQKAEGYLQADQRGTTFPGLDGFMRFEIPDDEATVRTDSPKMAGYKRALRTERLARMSKLQAYDDARQRNPEATYAEKRIDQKESRDYQVAEAVEKNAIAIQKSILENWETYAVNHAMGNPHGKANSLHLADVLDHPLLYEAYPELAELPVILLPSNKMNGARGAYSEEKGILYLSTGHLNDVLEHYEPVPGWDEVSTIAGDANDALSTALHETQHAVQHVEGFSTGSSMSIAYSELRAEAMAAIDADPVLSQQLNALPQGQDRVSFVNRQIIQRSGQTDLQGAVFWRYMNTYGEIEAREVQKRMGWPAHERLATPPLEDIDARDVVVRFMRSATSNRLIDFAQQPRAQAGQMIARGGMVNLFDRDDARGKPVDGAPWGLYLPKASDVQAYLDRQLQESARFQRRPEQLQLMSWADQVDDELATRAIEQFEREGLVNGEDEIVVAGLWMMPVESAIDTATGERFYKSISHIVGGEREASIFLRQLGIDGIRLGIRLSGDIQTVLFDQVADDVASRARFSRRKSDEDQLDMFATEASATPEPDQLTPAPELVALHNLSPSKLRFAHEQMGGKLPLPSLAVTKAGMDFDKFGQITLIAPRDLVDPKNTPIFDADVYSPRIPKATFERVPDEIAARAEDLQPLAEQLGIDGQSELQRFISMLDSEEKDLEEMTSSLSFDILPRMYYLQQQHGIEIEIEQRPKKVDFQHLIEQPALAAFLEAEVASIDITGDEVMMHDVKMKVNDLEFRAAMGKALAAALESYWSQFLDGKELTETIERARRSHLHSDGTMSYNTAITIARGFKELQAGPAMEPNVNKLRDDVEYEMEMLLADQGLNSWDVQTKMIKPWLASWLASTLSDPLLVTRSESGRVSRKPYTVENIVKKMRGQSVRAGEGFNYGIGSVRALGAEQFAKLGDVRAASSRIVDTPTMDNYKRQLDDDLGELASTLRESYKYDASSYGYMNQVLDVIAEFYKRGRPDRQGMEKALEVVGFVNVPSYAVVLAMKFADDLRLAPTEYFEAKARRAVDLSEFVAAVVPVGTQGDVLGILRTYGITRIEFYDDVGTDGVQRKRVIESMQGIRFQRRQTTTPEFKRWFGDWEAAPDQASKVVDDQGEPLVVYRGLYGGEQDENLFESTRLHTPTFSDSPAIVDQYARFTNNLNDRPVGPRVVPVYLSIKNPLVFAQEEDVATFAELADLLDVGGINDQADLEKVFSSDYVLLRDADGNVTEDITPETYTDTYVIADHPVFVEMAQRAGYDGMIYRGTAPFHIDEIKRELPMGSYDERGMSAMEYRPFSPAQIKSAIANTGEFDPASNNIRFARFNDQQRKRLRQLLDAQAGGPQTFGRPELANPGTDPKVRRVIDAVDQVRKEEGTPDRQTFEAWHDEAEARLDADYEGERARVLGGAMGDDPVAVIIAKRILQTEGREALAAGDEAAIGEYMNLVDQYRTIRTETARALAAGRDPVLTPAERAAGIVIEAVFSPSEKGRKRLAAIDEKMDTERQAAQAADIEAEAIEDEIDQARAAAEAVVRDRTRRETELALAEAAARQLEADVVEAERDAAKAKTATARELLRRRKSQLAGARERQAQAQAQLDSYEQDLEAARAELADVRDRRQKARDKAQRARSAIERAKQKILDDEAALAVEVRDVLAQQGIDVTDLSDEQLTDPVTIAQVIRTSQGVKSSWGDMMYEYWINAILSAPTTQAANIIGNTFNATWEFTVQRWAEIAINELLPGSKAGGPMAGELKYLYQGLTGPVLRQAWERAKLAMSTEMPSLEHELGLKPRTKLETHEKTIPGRLGRTIRLPGRMLVAADEFAKSIFWSMQVGAEAYRQAKLAGLEGEAMARYIDAETSNTLSLASQRAFETARYLTFQEDLGKWSKKLVELRGESRAIQYLLPFISTPSNILKIGFRKSPLGLVSLALRLARQGAYVMKGSRDAGLRYERPRMVRDLAEQVLAWAILWGLYGLVPGGDDDDELPRITGSATHYYNQAEVGFERRAIPATSIRIGGTWYNYTRIEPIGTSVQLAVDLIEGAKQVQRGADYTDVWAETWASITTLGSDKTFLQGVGDVFRAIERPTTGVPKWFANFATSWMPNIIKSAARSADDEFRDYRPRGEGLEYLEDLARKTGQRALPLEAFAPAAHVDVWGRTRERYKSTTGPMSDFLYRFTVPVWRQDVEKMHQLDRLLMNWNAQNPNDVYLPSLPSPTLQYRGETYRLSEEEYHAFLRIAGSNAAERLTRMQLDPVNPTEQDIETIRSVLRVERSRARQAVLQAIEQGRQVQRIIDEMLLQPQ